jgi:hypothetical protein
MISSFEVLHHGNSSNWKDSTDTTAQASTWITMYTKLKQQKLDHLKLVEVEWKAVSPPPAGGCPVQPCQLP